jgi:hypothetical protein
MSSSIGTEEVIRTATNSATDSEMKGLFGVSGDAYIIPIIGVFASTLLYFYVINSPRSNPNSVGNWAVVLLPAVACFGYVFYFIVNRPKRFRHDWLDCVLNGPNYNHKARQPVRHPYQALRKQAFKKSKQLYG